MHDNRRYVKLGVRLPMQRRTGQFFDGPSEIAYVGVQIGLGRRHRLVPQECLRRRRRSRCAHEIVCSRMPKLVHRVAGETRLLEIHHMDGTSDVLLVPDSELRTVCRRHNPRGG
jgi:hypothetical protein